MKQIGNPSEEETRTERAKLEKMSAILVYELVKKKLSYMKDQMREQLEIKQREAKQEAVQVVRGEEPLERYVRQLRDKNCGLEARIAELGERCDIISKFCDLEHKERIDITEGYKREIEVLKDEYKVLEQKLEEKEVGLLRTSEERAEVTQLQTLLKVREKEALQLREQQRIVEHKHRARAFGIQSVHIKVPQWVKWMW